MADQTPANGAETPRVPQMRLLGQYLKDLSFESPSSPGVLKMLREKPEMKIEMNTRNRKIEDNFEVELTIKATCDYGSTSGFVIEVTQAALVAFEDEANDQVRAILLNVEVPQLLFPYIRALISDMTAQGSFPPLVMQPIDFRQQFVARVQQEAAKAKKQ